MDEWQCNAPEEGASGWRPYGCEDERGLALTLSHRGGWGAMGGRMARIVHLSNAEAREAQIKIGGRDRLTAVVVAAAAADGLESGNRGVAANRPQATHARENLST